MLPGAIRAETGQEGHAVRTIAIVNQKGGCGKTTTAINLAAVLAKQGVRTLLVDMDPQSHCAAGLGVPESRIETGIAEAMLSDLDLGFDPGPMLWEVMHGLDLLPSTMMLAPAGMSCFWTWPGRTLP